MEEVATGGSVISKAMAPDWGRRRLQYERDVLTAGRYELGESDGSVFVDSKHKILASGNWPVSSGRRRPLDSYVEEEFIGTRYDVIPVVPWDRVFAYPSSWISRVDRVVRAIVNPNSLHSVVVFFSNFVYALALYILLQMLDEQLSLRDNLSSDSSIIVLISTFLAPVVIRAIFNITSSALDGAHILCADLITVKTIAHEAVIQKRIHRGTPGSRHAFECIRDNLLAIVNLLPLVHADIETRATVKAVECGHRKEVIHMLNGHKTPIAALESAIVAYIKATDELGVACGDEARASTGIGSHKTRVDRSWAHKMLSSRQKAATAVDAYRAVFVDSPVRFDIYLFLDIFFLVFMPIPMWQTTGAGMVVGFPVIRFLFSLIFGHSVAQASLLDYGSGIPTRNLFTVTEVDARNAILEMDTVD